MKSQGKKANSIQTLMKIVPLSLVISIGTYSQKTENTSSKDNPLGFFVGNWNYEEYFISESDTVLHGKSKFIIEDFYDHGVFQKWDGTDKNGAPSFKAISTIVYDQEKGIWILKTVRRFEQGNIRSEEWQGQKDGDHWKFVFVRASKGLVRLVRVTWKDPNNSSFYSEIDVSDDFGTTWRPLAYGIYKKN